MTDFASLTVPRVGKGTSVRAPAGSMSTTGGGGGGVFAAGVGGTGSSGAVGGDAVSGIGERLGSLAVPAVAAVSAAAVVISLAKLYFGNSGTRRLTIDTRARPEVRRAGARSNRRVATPGHPHPNQQQQQGEFGSPRLPGEKYVRMEEIGRGAFGVVYKGRHYRTGALVAIKEMDVSACEELRVEYRLLQGLRHPHIVDIKGFELQHGKARLYLEWCASGSLHTLVQRHGAVQEEDLLRSYVRQILLGLKFLHDHGILHRDIKPRNILVDHLGQLKLTDFGLSRHTASMQAQTRAAGTPVYMAPETPRGRFSIGSDLWAVGATISEIATGRMPWSHIDPHILDDPIALIFHIGNLQGQTGHHPEIPRHLSVDARNFLKQCFSPFPEQRGTCDDLLQHPFLREAPACGASSTFSPADSTATTSGADGRTTATTTTETATTQPSSSPTKSNMRSGATAGSSLSTDSSMRESHHGHHHDDNVAAAVWAGEDSR